MAAMVSLLESRIIVSKYDVKQEVTDKFSLRGRVFHKLREDILSGKYQEHEELKEVAIGEEMGVSRTPPSERHSVSWSWRD